MASTSKWLGWALGVMLLSLTCAAAQAPKTFAAVSIRTFENGERPAIPGGNFHSDPAGLHIFRRTLAQIICWAYDIQNFQLTGAPTWTGHGDWYNLDATTGAPATEAQQRLMLQAVLADRLGLKLKREDKPTPVMALVIAPGGPKLRELAQGEKNPPFGSLGAGTVTVRFATTEDLVRFYNMGGVAELIWGRPLVDDTRLTGRYDIRLAFPVIEEDHFRRMDPRRDLPKLLRRLGLNLKPETAPFPIYAVESIHPPTPN